MKDNRKIEEIAQAAYGRNRPQHQAMQQQQTYLGGGVLSPHALASVTGGNPPTFLRQRGFASISRSAAGIYVMTLSNALDIVNGDGVVYGGLNGTFAVGATVQFSPTTATTITVTLATLSAVPAAAAADISYWIVVQAIGPN